MIPLHGKPLPAELLTSMVTPAVLISAAGTEMAFALRSGELRRGRAATAASGGVPPQVSR